MDEKESQIFVITGTSSGIGRELAKFYSKMGDKVYGCSRGQPTFENINYVHNILDVSDEKAVREWIKKIKKESKKIDVLICNAGSVKSKLPVSLIPKNIAKEFIDTHFMGTFLMCREVSKTMIQSRYGRIINIATLAIPLHLEGTAAYSASKSAVIEMTKIMAKELAPSGITCNVLSPSLFLSAAAEKLGTTWAKELLSKQTIKRYAKTEDITNVISFFISKESSLITGQVINMALVD